MVYDQLDDGRITFMPEATPVQTISKDELYDSLKRHGQVQVVNVDDSKRNRHLGAIRGSLLIPLNELEDRLMELDKEKEIITYCSNADGSAARLAVRLLHKHGFSARVYEGGIEEWRSAGLATDLH
jgi:rhodanese-related sulfurtransferase